MIELNGVHFDKIRKVRVVEREHLDWEPTVCGMFPGAYSRWFDVNVNGEDLGLELDKDKAEQWIRDNIS